MKAAVYTRYGGPDVVSIKEVAQPEPRRGEILVEVRAAGVNTADWRIRAAAFPGAVMGLAGRAMFGICAPRHPVLGSEFAGRVAAVGADVTGFAPGDRVFGFAGRGAHAQYVTVKASGAVAPIPDGLRDVEAAALPFGALCALEFLGKFANVTPGARVLILGASGGVGCYAVQVARALGAIVTGVASASRQQLVERLGADHFVDYATTDPATLTGPYDVVFDTVGALDYAQVAPMLAQGGRFVPLNFGIKDIRDVRRARRNGHRLILRVNGDSRAGLDEIRDMIAAGDLRAVVDTVHPFEEICAAHAQVETRRRAGAVVLDLTDARVLQVAWSN